MLGGSKKLKALNVYIKIQNMFGSTEVQVDGENKKLWINSKEIKTNVDKFLSNLFYITALWEGEYYHDMLDAEELMLYISDGMKAQKIHCKGKYPINYGSLKNLVAEVKNG